MLRRFLVISLQPRAPSGQFLCVKNLVAILTKAASDYLPQAPNTTFVFKQINTQASITTCSILWPIKNQSSYLRQVTLLAQRSRGHLCAVYRMSSLWTTSVSSDNTSTCRFSNVLRGITHTSEASFVKVMRRPHCTNFCLHAKEERQVNSYPIVLY